MNDFATQGIHAPFEVSEALGHVVCLLKGLTENINNDPLEVGKLVLLLIVVQPIEHIRW